MWTVNLILLLVGSLNAHPKGHLRGGDEEITCRGIQELRKAPLAIISHLDCHETQIEDECAASTMDVLKFCIDGLKIDVDCVEKAFEDDLDEDTQECFCGELGNFANMLHNLEMLVCSRANSADSSNQRGGRSASGDGRGGRFLGGLGGGFWATSLNKPGFGSTSFNTSFPSLAGKFNKSGECGNVKSGSPIVNVDDGGLNFEVDKTFLLPTIPGVTAANSYAGGVISVTLTFDKPAQIMSVTVIDSSVAAVVPAGVAPTAPNANCPGTAPGTCVGATVPSPTVVFSPGAPNRVTQAAQILFQAAAPATATAELSTLIPYQPATGPLSVNLNPSANTYSFSVTVSAQNGNFLPDGDDVSPTDIVRIRVRYNGQRKHEPKVTGLNVNDVDVNC